MKKYFKKDIVIFFCVLAIFLGKIVRYTIMYDTLVVPGIGWSMIDNIVANNVKFNLTIANVYTDEIVNNASQNASAVFSAINIFGLKTYYSLEIFITILWNIIFLVIISKLKDKFNWLETIFIVASMAVLNIFDFCLAKEPIQILYFILMYIILITNTKPKFKYICTFLVYILCFLTYRNYYILMAGYMVFILVLYKFFLAKIENFKLKHVLFVLLSIICCYFVVLNVLKIIDMESFAELIRVRTRTSTAVSDIRAFFHSDNLIVFSFDYLIVILRMLFPIEMLRFGPKYFIYVAYQIIVTYLLYKTIRNNKSMNSTTKISTCIYVSFLLGSAAFEPDFGSWIRHEAAILPILFVLLNLNDKKYQDNEKNIL